MASPVHFPLLVRWLAAPCRVRVAGDDYAYSAPVQVQRQVREQISDRGAKACVVVDARPSAPFEGGDFAPTLCQLRFQ
jgi:hypothetical protein